MMWKTHIVFGVLCGLLALNIYDAGNLWIFFLLVVLGSLLPDIDERHSKINKGLSIVRWLSIFVKHRGIFHSIFIPLLLGSIIWTIFDIVYALPLFIGYVSHLVIDSFTKTGINFLHPIAKFRISGFVETGSILETFIFIGISAGIIVLLV